MGNNAVYVLLAFVPSFVIYLGFPEGEKQFLFFDLLRILVHLSSLAFAPTVPKPKHS